MATDDPSRMDALKLARERGGAWHLDRLADALVRMRLGGELGEIAEVEGAWIEADGTLQVYICDNHGEEAQGFTPEDLRTQAFELLALADYAEAHEARERG